MDIGLSSVAGGKPGTSIASNMNGSKSQFTATNANFEGRSSEEASEDMEDFLNKEFQGIDKNLIKQELRFRIYKLVKHHVHEK